MCGIAGAVAFTPEGEKYLKGIGSAVQSLRFRGPDQSGTYLDRNVALGQSRLAVIDTSDAASQPFSDSSGRYTLVFNGEIYNYRELKKELEQKGVAFRSSSDTEVLLYLFIQNGPSFLEKLNGFFAFCIYDKQERTLFLARDRMGIKPLYFYRDRDSFLFASEMKALMAMGIPRVLNQDALFAYLQLNYIPGPLSIFRNVVKAEPGMYYIAKNGDVKGERYYRIPYTPVRGEHDDYDTACSRIRELLDLSVQRRMIADVPLGTFLSGGIDSSIITGIAARHTSKLNTFSIGFSDEPLFDETRYAEEVARVHHTDHHAFRLNTSDLYDALFNVLDYIDEPFADSSALAVYILSRETRKYVTVALSGDGADELYGGYIKHSAECRMRKPGLREQLVNAAHPLWKALPKSRHSKFTNRIRQLDRFAKAMDLSPEKRYWQLASIANENDAAILFNSFPLPVEYFDMKYNNLSFISKTGDLNDVLYADMHLVLRNDMLVKVDMMSMANSLEVRVPFLDHEHVEYVFSLPWFFKAGRDFRKKVLREAFCDLLPENIYHRNKHGFEVPLLRWFRTELKPMITQDLLSEERIRAQGLFSPDAVANLVRRLYSSDPGDTAARIWGLIVFQVWWKKHMGS